MQMYDWGVFWEDGNRASLPVPFGPEAPDNIIPRLDGEWIGRILVYLPNFIEAMNELPFALIIVNPPRQATGAEIEYWKDMGYESP